MFQIVWSFLNWVYFFRRNLHPKAHPHYNYYSFNDGFTLIGITWYNFIDNPTAIIICSYETEIFDIFVN